MKKCNSRRSARNLPHAFARTITRGFAAARTDRNFGVRCAISIASIQVEWQYIKRVESTKKGLDGDKAKVRRGAGGRVCRRGENENEESDEPSPPAASSVGRSSIESDGCYNGIELDYEGDSDGNEDGSDDSWLWRTYPSSVDPVSEEDSDEGSGVGSGDAFDDASAASDRQDAEGSPGSQPLGPGLDADGSSDSEGLSI